MWTRLEKNVKYNFKNKRISLMQRGKNSKSN